MNKKVAIILYHSNITKYGLENIKNCLLSLQNQTFKDFSIFELCYDKKNKFSIVDFMLKKEIIKIDKKKHRFFMKELDNHIDAMNYLLNILFNQLNYDIAFNTNIDDTYDITKLEKQVKFMTENNIDFITSNYYLTDDNGKMNEKIFFSSKDIKTQKVYIKDFMTKNKMIVQMSGACISKKYYKENGDIEYHTDFPLLSDILYIKKGLKNKNIFYIYPETLMKQKIHKNMFSWSVRN